MSGLYYDIVPKDYVENLRWRFNIGMKARSSKKLQAEIIEACRHDILFYLNGWAILHEPRRRYGIDGKLLPNKIPFITWPHQDGPILEMRANLGVRDIGVEKSRDEGVSWSALHLAVHDWLFSLPGREAKVGIVSSSEDLSDNPDNKDSLLAKVDMVLDSLPPWMAGKRGVDYRRNTTKHTLRNLRNDAEITAFAATADVGRGGRYLWFFFDELASTAWQREAKDEEATTAASKSTDSRLFVSTPNGTTGAYYRLLHTPSNMLRVRLAWWDNPTKNRGLYRLIKEKVVAVDAQDNPLLASYNPPSKDVIDRWSRLRRKGFQLDKGVRSDWYDNECDKADSTPQTIAKELDMNYGGTTYRVFGEHITSVIDGTLEPPRTRGYLTVTSGGSYDYEEVDKGPFLLWCDLDHQGNPPEGQYLIACDISGGGGGTYTSNSVLVVIDIRTRAQVAEFAINTMEPYEFCKVALSAAKWFHNAYLAWEHMGPGTGFTTQVMESGYGNFFKRKVTWRKRNRVTYEPGWITNRNTKEILCSDLIAAIKTGDVLIRSKEMRDEFQHYVRLGGQITHALIKNATDDAQGASHGDRVIAIGLAVQAMKDRPLPAAETPQEKVWTPNSPPPYGTWAHRNWQHNQEAAKLSDEWDDRSTSDLRQPRGSSLILSY